MTRPISTLIAELHLMITELKEAYARVSGAAPALPTGAHQSAKARPAKRAARSRKAVPAAAAPEAPPKAVSAPSAKARTPSPKRVLQGKYMSALRKLGKGNQAKVRKLRATEGVEAALAFAASKTR
jgi:hypothetical protein